MNAAGDLSGTGTRRRLTVFVLIDALGWRLLEGYDFLSDLLPYRSPVRTVLGFSSGAIPTILTGAPPSETGHWNLFYFDPHGSPFRWLRPFLFLPNAALDNRYSRKVLKELGRHILGLGPLFECSVSPRLLPWFNWVEKKNIYSTGAIRGASSIFDRLAQNSVPFCVYSYHDLTDQEILESARHEIAAGKNRFLFLYLSQLDLFLHHHCQEPERITSRLDWYAAGLRQLYEAARAADPDFTFTVFSDHGMTPVHTHYDLVSQVQSVGYSMPEDYLAVYDSTMARFWFFKEAARRAVADCLRQVPCGRLLEEQELRELGVYFSDQRYGELILVLHPGWLLSKSDFNGRSWNPKGMHGYHPDDPYSDAIFLSNRQPPVPLTTIADLYQCLEEAA